MFYSSIYSNITELQKKTQKIRATARVLECSPDLPPECYTTLAGIIKEQAGDILLDLYAINELIDQLTNAANK